MRSRSVSCLLVICVLCLAGKSSCAYEFNSYQTPNHLYAAYLAQPQSLTASPSGVPNIQNLNKIVGDAGEELMDYFYKRAGYKKIPSQVGPHGVDGVYAKKTGGVWKTVISEAKTDSSRLINTKAGVQMSPEKIASDLYKKELSLRRELQAKPGSRLVQRRLAEIVKARQNVASGQHEARVFQIRVRDGNLLLESRIPGEKSVRVLKISLQNPRTGPDASMVNRYYSGIQKETAKYLEKNAGVSKNACKQIAERATIRLRQLQTQGKLNSGQSGKSGKLYKKKLASLLEGDLRLYNKVYSPTYLGGAAFQIAFGAYLLVTEGQQAFTYGKLLLSEDTFSDKVVLDFASAGFGSFAGLGMVSGGGFKFGAAGARFFAESMPWMQTFDHLTAVSGYVAIGAFALKTGVDVFRWRAGYISTRDFSVNTANLSGMLAGAYAGAQGGGLLGAAIGSIVPIFGTGVGASAGAFVGGIAGAWGGSAAASSTVNSIFAGLDEQEALEVQNYVFAQYALTS